MEECDGIRRLPCLFYLFLAFVCCICLIFGLSVSPWEGKICLGRRGRRKGNGSQGREGLKTPGWGHYDDASMVMMLAVVSEVDDDDDDDGCDDDDDGKDDGVDDDGCDDDGAG